MLRLMMNPRHSRPSLAVFLASWAPPAFLALGCGRQERDSNPKVARKLPVPRHPAGSGRGSSAQHPPAHLRRGERRGLLLPGRPRAGLPADPPPVRVRPDLPHAGRPAGSRPGEQREGAHHLRLLSPRRRVDPLRLHPSRLARLPAPARLQPGLRLGDLPVLRHLRADGLGQPDPLTDTPRATTPRPRSAPAGDRIVFTSIRDGDLDLYIDERGRDAA